VFTKTTRDVTQIPVAVCYVTHISIKLIIGQEVVTFEVDM